VRTETNDYVLEFDPASDLPRYHSRLTSSQLSQSKTTVTEFADDHLREHMLQFQKNDSINSLLKFDNAVYLSSVLSKLRSSFNVISISNVLMETMPQSVAQKGLK